MNPAILPVLDGPRLRLRPMCLADAEGPYLRWMNDPQVTRHLESRFTAHSRDDLRGFIQSMVNDPRYVFLAICIRESDRHVGNIKLGPIVQPHRLADVGMIIGETDCWGLGFATEAVRLISQHAFEQLQLHKLTAGCYGTNLASARALQKAGFVIEAVRPSHFLQDGVFVDYVVLGQVNPRELTSPASAASSPAATIPLA